jgi:hypothetical protein
MIASKGALNMAVSGSCSMPIDQDLALQADVDGGRTYQSMIIVHGKQVGITL